MRPHSGDPRKELDVRTSSCNGPRFVGHWRAHSSTTACPINAPRTRLSTHCPVPLSDSLSLQLFEECDRDQRVGSEITFVELALLFALRTSLPPSAQTVFTFSSRSRPPTTATAITHLSFELDAKSACVARARFGC